MRFSKKQIQIISIVLAVVFVIPIIIAVADIFLA